MERDFRSARCLHRTPALRTPRHKRGLEAQEVEDVAGRVGIAVAGVRVIADELVLGALNVEDVQHA